MGGASNEEEGSESKIRFKPKDDGCFEIAGSGSNVRSGASSSLVQDWNQAYQNVMSSSDSSDDSVGPLGAGFNESQNDQGGYHRTLYDWHRNNHISWDTDANDDYIPGTGHEDSDGRKISDWDG
jgi:hypothetical protein